MHQRSHVKGRLKNPIVLVIYASVDLRGNLFFCGGLKLEGKLDLEEKGHIENEEM